MSSPFDFVTEGLIQSSQGLLVLSDVDARVLFDPFQLVGDLVQDAGDLEADNGMMSALLMSLFCDRRATAEELARHGGSDPRGFWGDGLTLFDGDRWGSGLWLLEREIQTPETLNRAREYALEATAWLIEDGIARSVEVEARYPVRSYLGLGLTIERGAQSERFAFVWGI